MEKEVQTLIESILKIYDFCVGFASVKPEEPKVEDVEDIKETKEEEPKVEDVEDVKETKEEEPKVEDGFEKLRKLLKGIK